MGRWRIQVAGKDEEILERAPGRFVIMPTKTMEYKRTIDNKIVRVIPAKFPVENYIEVEWYNVDLYFRNKFYDLFVNDTKFTIKSHLWRADNPEQREIWTVKIDKFESPYKYSGNVQKWDLHMELRVLDGTNDPIIKKTFTQTPFSFVVENKTNRVIHDGAFLFVRPIPRDFVDTIDGDTNRMFKCISGDKDEIPHPDSEQWIPI